MKKIKFGELRDESLTFHLGIEAKMLDNYAKILIQILSNDPQGVKEANLTLSSLFTATYL